MPSLREVRKRLRSVEHIQQLTKAMEMVAASRLHYAQIKTKHTRIYLSKIQELLYNLAQALPNFRHPLCESRETQKIGLIVIAADMGLSGSYNKEVLLTANQFLKQRVAGEVELIAIGRKAVEYYQRRTWPIRHQVAQMTDMTSLQVQLLADQLATLFLNKELDEIWCVYTHYVNMMSRKVLTAKFLSVDPPLRRQPAAALNYLFEPAPEEIYTEILWRYVRTQMQFFLDEAYSSELAARVFAMKTATQNADEMIERLTLIRNKVRQGEITKEMLEITSGAENLTH